VYWVLGTRAGSWGWGLGTEYWGRMLTFLGYCVYYIQRGGFMRLLVFLLGVLLFSPGGGGYILVKENLGGYRWYRDLVEVNMVEGVIMIRGVGGKLKGVLPVGLWSVVEIGEE
jgi:hypothetical protein